MHMVAKAPCSCALLGGCDESYYWFKQIISKQIGNYIQKTMNWCMIMFLLCLTPFCSLGSSPHLSIRYCTTLRLPPSTALWRQLSACMLRSNFLSPNFAARYLTHGRWPPKAAQCNAFAWDWRECLLNDMSSKDAFKAFQTLAYILIDVASLPQQHLCGRGSHRISPQVASRCVHGLRRMQLSLDWYPTIKLMTIAR